MYTLHEVTEEHELNLLLADDALTFEGITPEEASYEFLIKWLKDNGAFKGSLDIYNIKGKIVNDAWSLTGDNRYPDDLNIMCVPLSQIDFMKIIIKRFEIGGRWLSDCLENSLRREREKAGEE